MLTQQLFFFFLLETLCVDEFLNPTVLTLLERFLPGCCRDRSGAVLTPACTASTEIRSDRSCRSSLAALSTCWSRTLVSPCWPSTTHPAWTLSPVWRLHAHPWIFLFWKSPSAHTLPARQHDGGSGGEGDPAGELGRWERPHRSGCCWNILLRIRPQRRPSHIQPTGTQQRNWLLGYFLVKV